VEHEIIIEENQVLIDGQLVNVDLSRSGAPEIYSLLVDGRSYEVLVEEDRSGYSVTLKGEQYQVRVEDERTRRLNAGRSSREVPKGEFSIKAPIPGLVVKVLVAEGEPISEEQPLVILEAMKMENEIRSPRDGVVRKIEVTAGQSIEQNGVLLVLA
jgi:biotin carboxyl carrier protein